MGGSHNPPPDFHELEASLSVEAAGEALPELHSKDESSDFESLHAALPDDPKQYQYRTATDFLIDFLTPLMILLMVYSIIFFLLDVRYIYSEVHDKNLRFLAGFFVLGIVAVNRVVATDNTGESYMYVMALGAVMAFYTFVTTSAYDVGSVARNFLNNPYQATMFNMVLVVFMWWLVNRLMYECIIDENKSAGDVGILTGSARKMYAAIQRGEEKPPKKKLPRRRPKDHILESIEIEPFDPLEWKPEEIVRKAKIGEAPSKRLSKKHPGISILYFSLPVMAIFALGLPVLMQGGERMMLLGNFYVAIYTVTALSLLMLTSLGGLREYFRSRRVHFPRAIGVFWVSLGSIMIAAVSIAAFQLPLPSLPPIAYVDEHQTDFWTQGSTFKLKSIGLSAGQMVASSKALDRIGQTVLVIFGLFIAYGVLRFVGNRAAQIARRRDRYPEFVVRFFDRLDKLLLRYLRLPTLPRIPGLGRRKRISRDVATCVHINNPMTGQGTGSGEDVAEYVAISYDALCALAYDLGVPRKTGDTPYEFIHSFPKELKSLKAEALELTELYVRSAYSPTPLDDSTFDRLRTFWMAYEKVRRGMLR